LRRPAAFATGIVLAIGGVAMVATAIVLRFQPCGHPCGGVGGLESLIIGPVGGAFMLGSVGLLWAGWPPPLRSEPLSAHPELVDTPVPNDPRPPFVM
jgi:hypothetical protein